MSDRSALKALSSSARFVLVAAVTLSACKPSASTYTVEYYVAHDEEREAKLAECDNDPGALRDDPLCINAQQAGVREGFGSLRDLPPMGLLDAKKQREEEERRRQESEGSNR